MNLIVLKADGSWYTRPDSTLCRVREDFFLPEEFESAEIRKCLYLRVARAGKAILPKFAGRYFEPFCEGYLFYGIDGEGWRCPYIDRSTVLEEDRRASLPDEETIGRICGVSSVMTLRRGDLAIIESQDCSILRQGDTFETIEIK